MPKELIVSVNGREKKIAIIENGRVTEFYIERGESSQGIVGNIYKGRVMRVLPGMQSAFVDIGLERDAFLYVSDFFDEEEEFERIVVDKKKTEGADDEAAARAAAERIERARVEREHQMETAQERAEPILDAEPGTDESETDDAREVEAPEPPAVGVAQAAAAEEEAGRRRGKRKRGRDRGAGEGRSSETGLRGAEGQRTDSRVERAGGVGEDIATPFIAGADSFQRVVDEDEAAFDDGAMFKDARVQERLLDQIRGVEFDMEDVPAVEVGSLLSNGAQASGSSFQRIADDDAPDMPIEGARQTPRRAAVSVGKLAGEFDEASGTAANANAATFERVSDDEQGAGTGTASRGRTSEEKPARAASRSASKRGGASKKAKSEAADEARASAETPKKKASSGSRTGASKTATKKTAAAGGTKKSAATKGGSKRRKSAAADAASEIATESQQEAGSNDESGYQDSKASVSSRPSRGEFARRGGRRRRRPGGKPGAEGVEGDDAGSNGHSEEAEPMIDAEEPAAQVAPVEATTAKPRSPRSHESRGPSRSVEARAARDTEARAARDTEVRGGRDTEARGGRDAEARGGRDTETRGGRGGDGRRSGGDNGRGSDRSSDTRGRDSRGGGGRDRRERPPQPTITDLLREGQEIIVQIAKEPIAQKGARITSHIALPGRFLVYMPTIEHVGVSRKIESDAERTRLRKLIQSIVKEEDVPSGGFIVRTAGVGITEQDLRDDARYLVRTWRDIRRNTEKAKAPSIAHRDLDLVQRILRDQLSEDFTAIRVDSDDEYRAIVEFINRIQPRLVNRVKLYTREEPILEAFGVQAEIEKAIKPRVWLKSGGYLVINQTEALVAIDVNTGKFVGRGGSRLEDTITRTNLEAVDEIARQIRLRDLGGIIVLDLIDMEERRNRQRVMTALQDALRHDKSPTKVLSFNDFGLVIMTRKRVKQSLERTLCSPCPYCQGSSLVKSPQTVCYEILEEARRLARSHDGERIKQTTLRLNPEVARALRSTERDVLAEIEDYLGAVDITSDEHVHQEQFDFAVI
jgi:ribonuclease G